MKPHTSHADHFIEYTRRDVLPQLERRLEMLQSGAPAQPPAPVPAAEHLVQIRKAPAPPQASRS